MSIVLIGPGMRSVEVEMKSLSSPGTKGDSLADRFRSLCGDWIEYPAGHLVALSQNGGFAFADFP